MGELTCPVCDRIVPPLGLSDPEKTTNGHAGDTLAEQLPVESRTCPTCRTRLERTPPGTWRVLSLQRRAERKLRRRFSRPS